MSLVRCPECSKLISDQASTCPKCGYPLYKKASSDSSFSIVSEWSIPPDKHWALSSCLRINDAELKERLQYTPAILKTNLTYDEAKMIQSSLSELGIYVSIADKSGKSQRMQVQSNEPRREQADPVRRSAVSKKAVVSVCVSIAAVLVLLAIIIPKSSSRKQDESHDKEQIAAVTEAPTQKPTEAPIEKTNSGGVQVISGYDFPRRTPKPSPTQSARLSTKECVDYIDSCMTAGFSKDEYEIDQLGNIINVYVWHDGLALETLEAKSGNRSYITAWNNLVESLQEASMKTSSSLTDFGRDDIVLMFNYVNELNKDRILLSVSDGVVFYDEVNGIDILG